jgi:hypothetical protein
VFGFLRRRRLPTALRPPLDRNERVVAWASTPGDGEGRSAVVVTDRGLWLPGRADRLDWHQIHKATWSGSQLTVVPAVQVDTGEGYAVMADDAAVGVRLADPDNVPPQVRNRVNRSVAYTKHHALPRGGVRVVARRVAGVDGVTWHVRFDEGTDTGDPSVVEATAELVAAASATSASD